MNYKEIIEAYEEGLLTLRATFGQIADLAASGDIEKNLRSLPLIWRKDVELYVFYMYDNDIDPDDFIYIGRDDPDLVLRRKNITALRLWIARRKVTEPFTRDAVEP